MQSNEKAKNIDYVLLSRQKTPNPDAYGQSKCFD